jgi:arylsulfatase
VHAPHQVAKEWSDKYKGKFDEGWDVYREKVFANEKKLGVIPANAILPPRNPNIKAWNSLPAEEKKLYASFMEVYAGYLTYTDYEVSRVINYLKEINQLDNTLVFVIIGDNGASKEGTYHGVAFPKKIPVATTEESEYVKQNLQLNADEIGTPESFPNYPLGWAQAANTPFKYWKQDANSEGGTHNPLIVFYPKGIKEKGGIRNQYGHVIDLLPTTVEFIGAKIPAKIRGIDQDTIQGKSLVYSFENAKAPSVHTTQYYYIFGSRSIYKDGWKAGAAHYPDNIALNDFTNGNVPGDQSFEKDKWELYNLNEDFNENVDLAAKNPQKLAELKALFDEQAKLYNIYPFVDWSDVYKKRKALNAATAPVPATSTK